MQATNDLNRWHRFWKKVIKGDPDQCWLWTASRKGGYGQFVWETGLAPMTASRAAYMLIHGKLSSDMHVLHSCDNRLCVNPAHLRAGTNMDNVRDALERNRIPRGEQRPEAKLNTVQVLMIHFLSWAGARSEDLAEGFGVSGRSIRAIKNGRNWKHIHQLLNQGTCEAPHTVRH